VYFDVITAVVTEIQLKFWKF